MVALSSIKPNPIMKPVEAYRHIVSKNVEYVELDKIDTKDKRVVAAMIVPYPPGIPIVMGGEVLDDSYKPVLEYLIARQNFENEYPGYESDIHGIERTGADKDGKKYFMAMLIKN